MNNQEAKKLEKKVLRELKTLQENHTIIAAISGGADSIFLLHFLSQTPAQIIVAHLNHQLRPEANDDEDFVQEISKSNRFKSKRVNISAESKKHSTGIEETGRKERYKFFNELAKKHKAKFIITAHHADDNLETILLNFTRGAGLKGLSGMQKIENNLFRPLLDISKTEILAYLQLKKIGYREDESNKDNKYNRNFLRNEIIPKLKEINPSIVKTIRKNTENLREIQERLEEEAEVWISANEISKNTFDAKKFRTLPPTTQKTVLLKIHQKLVGNTNNISSTHLQEVLKIITANVGNKKKKLGPLIIAIKNNHLRVEN
jgi:tRNA(Ile)-lysidine synthase